MYVLDTNVVSEFRKLKAGRADQNVTAWAAAVRPSVLFLSVMTIMELEHGTLLMERRDPVQGAMLRHWLDTTVLPSFSARILPIDKAIVLRCARLHVPDRKGERDALIAATALVHGMTVVTRDVADFAGTGVTLIDPWTAQ